MPRNKCILMLVATRRKKHTRIYFPAKVRLQPPPCDVTDSTHDPMSHTDAPSAGTAPLQGLMEAGGCPDTPYPSCFS